MSRLNIRDKYMYIICFRLHTKNIIMPQFKWHGKTHSSC